MVERAFDQRLRAGLAIFFEQVPFEAAGIDADPHRAAVRLGGVDHLAHPLGRADIAGVDPAGRRRRHRRPRARACSGNGCRRRSARATARTICPSAAVYSASGQETRTMSAPASSQRRIWSIVALTSGGRRVGHGLHGDGRAAADRHVADHDLPRHAPLYVSPGPYRHGAHIGLAVPSAKRSQAERRAGAARAGGVGSFPEPAPMRNCCTATEGMGRLKCQPWP